MRFTAFSFLLLAAFLISSPLLATGGDAQGARNFVQSVGERALAVVKEGAGDGTRAKLEKMFIDNVDIAWIGKFVLGKHWRAASEEQRKQYMENYQRFIVKNYTKNFTDYAGGDFKVTGAREERPGEFLVSMEILRPGAQPVLVDYRIRKNGEYKVFDIIVEGVSLINTQRSEFGSVVSREGMDRLIEQLGSRGEAEEAQGDK